jgi:hypothetical protein
MLCVVRRFLLVDKTFFSTKSILGFLSMSHFFRSGLFFSLVSILAGCQNAAPPQPVANKPTPLPVIISPSGSPVSPATPGSISISPVPTVFFTPSNNTPGTINPITGQSSGSIPSGVPETPSIAAPVAKGSYQVLDEQTKPQYVVDSRKILTAGNLPAGKINFEPDKMLTVLTNTRAYFSQSQDPNLTLGGILGTQGVSPMDTVKTLDFAIATLREDLQAKRPSRLQDPNFIRQNFRTIQWNAADPKQPSQSKIRITKYAVFTHPGSRTKTDKFDTAVYSLKDPRAKAAKYTKQEVLAGIYEKAGKDAFAGQVEPIAYLTRDGLEEALMEGTILIKFNDGTQGFFNVDRSNEIAYVKGLDRKEQKRYWYFKPVDKIKGYGQAIENKISIEPGVTFAGDVLNIGLGKLVVISSPDGMRMGAIADTGGAFLPNLHQLDFLAGTFDGKPAFDKVVRSLPEYATAYFLIKK